MNDNDETALNLIHSLPHDSPLRQLLSAGMPLAQAKAVIEANLDVEPVLAMYRNQRTLETLRFLESLDNLTSD